MIGKILGNRYEIVEKVGGGGMALVYKAKCRLLNRYVAVKVLRAEFTNDTDIIEKFKRESQAAASLSHPNIVNVYDVGEEGEIYYIVMEYIKGKTLKEIIQEKKVLDTEEIISYTKQIALALQHAHSNHVIHRDIKPHNIMITEDNRVKVTDFGIALAATSSTITNMGNVIGSVHYFSPEQARGGYTDEKSDLYSLGIVMYEMATGKLPYEGDSPVAIALKHIQGNPKLPSEINSNISRKLEKIILKLIQKDQSLRYQNTKDLLEDIEQLKEDVDFDYDQNNINYEDSPTQIIPRIDYDQISPMEIENEPETENINKKRKNKTIIISAILTALLAAGLFTFGLFYISSLFNTEEIEVPNFVGMHIEEAREEAERLGLALKESTQESSEVEANRIIRQNPADGRKVKAGFPIDVVVSTGTSSIVVPDLVYKPGTEVDYILENYGLKAGIPQERYSEFPVGVVIEQDPVAGSEVAKGTTVNYVISLGPETVTIPMPNLIGVNIETAKQILAQQNLQLGNVKEDYSDEYKEGIVMDQNIAAGVQITEDTTVNLVVSKGALESTEPEIPENNNLPPDGSNNTNGDNTAPSDDVVTKYIDISLPGHSGVVDILIKRLPNGEVVVSKKHDIERNGEKTRVSLSGTKGTTVEFELHINGVKHDTNIILNF
ncbi:MAG: Stk1 family PASTA domain-containing Ser/Thr kinase [Clostridiales bacterium]|nr:Stk1 family PASTA domain-containing Ser/Thr kinase [Clostridiales bacterium]